MKVIYVVARLCAQVLPSRSRQPQNELQRLRMNWKTLYSATTSGFSSCMLAMLGKQCELTFQPLAEKPFHWAPRGSSSTHLSYSWHHATTIRLGLCYKKVWAILSSIKTTLFVSLCSTDVGSRIPKGMSKASKGPLAILLLCNFTFDLIIFFGIWSDSWHTGGNMCTGDGDSRVEQSSLSRRTASRTII